MKRQNAKSIASLVIISFIVCLIAPNSTVNASYVDDWSMFRHDPAHTGYTNSSAPITTPVVLWSFQAHASIISSPAIVDDKIYTTTGILHCLDTSNGSEIWSSSGGSVSPTVLNGVVYVGATAYNASTGFKIWSSPFGGDGSPTIVNGALYVGGNGFYAYNASTGAKLWNHTKYEIISAPAVSNGIAYFGGYSIVAVNCSKGSEIWHFAPKINEAQTYRFASPSVSDGFVYVGLSDSFYCLNALTGEKVWDNPKGAFGSSPAVANGIVYFGSQDGTVYAVNASSGEKIWSYQTGWLVDSSPAVTNDAVYVGSGDGNLYALNASDGAKLWNFTLQPFLDERGIDRYLFASPAIANGVIYMGSNDGAFYALGSQIQTEFPFEYLIATIIIVLLFVTAIVIVRTKKIPKALR
jgi:outer membrane protein assembly factor BamB